MRILGKYTFAVGLSVAIAATATLAASHGSSNKAVEARHQQMGMIAYHTGVLAAIAKGEADFDAATVAAASTNLQALASLDTATLWTPGTEQGAADGSRAKPEIWSDAAGFQAKFDDLKMAAAAVGGASDAAAVGAAMAGIGGACKGCHETYRGPKN